MIRLIVSNERHQEERNHDTGPLHIGRNPEDAGNVLVIDDPYMSRQQLVVEEVAPGRIRLDNLSKIPVSLDDGQGIGEKQFVVVELPRRITVGSTVIDVLAGSAGPSANVQTIVRPAGDDPSVRQSLAELGRTPSPDTLARWFEGLLTVTRAAAGSSEFYTETARAVVDLIGLDRGLILLQNEGKWEIIAAHPAEAAGSHEYSATILAKMVDQQSTCYEAFDGPPPSHSLAGVQVVVASPVFDERNKLVGAVYGSREATVSVDQCGITPLEAQVVQLLAAAASAGLARAAREAEAIRTRVQFEQFFSPALIRQLEKDPVLLEGQERQVTVLFSDLRGFSGISQTLGARLTYELLRSVMDDLTNRIVEHGGVIVDYHGDGLAAMWNAPAADSDHACRACEAAIAMLESLPGLNERWEPELGDPLRIGIGVNTGVAQVGNAGSQRVLKYGPLGHTVNLASRVEGASKHLGVPFLITESARNELDDRFITRRLCRVRAVGMDEAVRLFECRAQPVDESWIAWRDRFEQVLASLETGGLEDAAEGLEAVRADPLGTNDRPSQIVAELMDAARLGGNGAADAVYTLPAK